MENPVLITWREEWTKGLSAAISEGRREGWMKGWRAELSATCYFQLVEPAWGWQARGCQWTLCRRRSQVARHIDLHGATSDL